MDDIKKIVGKVIKDIADKGPTRKQELQSFWECILEDKEFKHTKIKEINNNALIVLVDSPVWLYQCNLKKKKFLTEVQKEFPEIKNIYFKIGKVR